MAHSVSTQEGDGENDAKSSDKPTLKEFISRELGQNADQIYTKLTSEFSITDIDTLIYCKDEHIDELCKELKLAFGEKLKFSAGIRKLKSMYQPQSPQAIVTISKQEQTMIDKVNLGIKQANDIQQILEKHFNSVDDHLSAIKSQVDAKIDAVMLSLQNRKKSLHQQVFFIFIFAKSHHFHVIYSWINGN